MCFSVSVCVSYAFSLGLIFVLPFFDLVLFFINIIIRCCLSFDEKRKKGCEFGLVGKWGEKM